jgi:quercetin dioxygenase-like cupin family protein
MTLHNFSRQVNPSEETIRVGPLTIRFLLTGGNSNASIAAFELSVPARERLLGPAHSHDRYEETIYGIEGVLTFTVDGSPIDIGPGQASCNPARCHSPFRQQRKP